MSDIEKIASGVCTFGGVAIAVTATGGSMATNVDLKLGTTKSEDISYYEVAPDSVVFATGRTGEATVTYYTPANQLMFTAGSTEELVVDGGDRGWSATATLTDISEPKKVNELNEGTMTFKLHMNTFTQFAGGGVYS